MMSKDLGRVCCDPNVTVADIEKFILGIIRAEGTRDLGGIFQLLMDETWKSAPKAMHFARYDFVIFGAAVLDPDCILSHAKLVMGMMHIHEDRACLFPCGAYTTPALLAAKVSENIRCLLSKFRLLWKGRDSQNQLRIVLSKASSETQETI